MEPIQTKSVWVAHIMAFTALILVLVWALAEQVMIDVGGVE